MLSELINVPTNCKLTTVIAKPMQLVNVSAVPVSSLGADCAIIVENCGESGTTEKPQIKTNNENGNKPATKIHGDNKQHKPEQPNAAYATNLLPKRDDAKPPTMLPIAPDAMIANDQTETFRFMPFRWLNQATSIGTKAQNV